MHEGSDAEFCLYKLEEEREELSTKYVLQLIAAWSPGLEADRAAASQGFRWRWLHLAIFVQVLNPGANLDISIGLSP